VEDLRRRRRLRFKVMHKVVAGTTKDEAADRRRRPSL
jgi:hypothetical protein